MLVAVLASWPADLEPRLTPPNAQRTKIAPLTLTYGQSPAIQGTTPQTEYAALAASWPTDLEPRLAIPNATRVSVAPLTLTYGTSPPISGTAAVTHAQIRGAWPPDLEPRLTGPNDRRVQIAPLTLSYGQPPTPRLAADFSKPVAAWTETWGAQTASGVASWNVPPPMAALPRTPPPAHLWTAWEPPFVAPPRPVQIAPLALVYGATPPVQGTTPQTEYAQIVAAWADPDPRPPRLVLTPQPLLVLVSVVPYAPPPALIWTAWAEPWPGRTAATVTASWNVPVVVASRVPSTPLQRHIWAAWTDTGGSPGAGPVPIAATITAAVATATIRQLALLGVG